MLKSSITILKTDFMEYFNTKFWFENGETVKFLNWKRSQFTNKKVEFLYVQKIQYRYMNRTFKISKLF
jgi:hypothetical protein